MADLDEDGLLEDLKIDTDLEGFLSGSTTGMVNLQPQPMSLGSAMDDGQTPTTEGAAKAGEGGTAAAAIGAATAAAGAAAGALMGGNFGMAQTVLGGAIGKVANVAVPTGLQPMKETAGSFLQKAQPWKDFLLPLSFPAASDGCSRMTANIYNFQTNYAILFVIHLLLTIVFQPSALICIAMTVVVWVFFLKKNDDPDWAPVVGGVQLGPVQRWLALAALTAIILLFVAGSTIFNAALMYVLFMFVHGVVHDPSAKGIPGSGSPGGLSGPPVPL